MHFWHSPRRGSLLAMPLLHFVQGKHTTYCNHSLSSHMKNPVDSWQPPVFSCKKHIIIDSYWYTCMHIDTKCCKVLYQFVLRFFADALICLDDQPSIRSKTIQVPHCHQRWRKLCNREDNLFSVHSHLRQNRNL